MRDLLLILGISVAAIALGVILFLFGPKSLQSDINNALLTGEIGTTGSTSFVVLQQGPDAISVVERTNYRITSLADLRALWPIIYGDRDAPPIPNVDFNKYEVLAIFDGSHSQGGYGVSITQILDKNPVRTITINHQMPNPSCPVTGPSSPFVLVQVSKSVFSLAHQDVTSVSTCGAN